MTGDHPCVSSFEVGLYNKTWLEDIITPGEMRERRSIQDLSSVGGNSKYFYPSSSCVSTLHQPGAITAAFASHCGCLPGRASAKRASSALTNLTTLGESLGNRLEIEQRCSHSSKPTEFHTRRTYLVIFTQGRQHFSSYSSSSNKDPRHPLHAYILCSNQSHYISFIDLYRLTSSSLSATSLVRIPQIHDYPFNPSSPPTITD